MRFLYAGLGLICVALAVIGIVLPLLPTVPFLLLAVLLMAIDGAMTGALSALLKPMFDDVLVAGQGAFWCQGCQMSGSTSSDRGGGLGILDNGVVNVTGNTISNCHAGGDGGAVALSQGSSVLVQSTLLTSNVN